MCWCGVHEASPDEAAEAAAEALAAALRGAGAQGSEALVLVDEHAMHHKASIAPDKVRWMSETRGASTAKPTGCRRGRSWSKHLAEAEAAAAAAAACKTARTRPGEWFSDHCPLALSTHRRMHVCLELLLWGPMRCRHKKSWLILPSVLTLSQYISFRLLVGHALSLTALAC